MTAMNQAYQVAAHAVRQRYAEQHPDDLHVLDGIVRDQVAVYSGSYDQVENILTNLDIPFRLNPGKRGLLDAKIAFVNCSNSYNRIVLNHMADFVVQGGFLVSSDWALDPVIATAFPNTVRKANGQTGDEVISVEPDLNSLWSDVVVLGADPQWWLERSSHPIQVLDAERVQVEAASHDLLRRYQTPVVAVSFDWEQGCVFHVISHFWCKRSRTPTARHQGSSIDFLKAGMHLSDEGIVRVFQEARIESAAINFAQMQSAATSTELVAQLCVRAIRNRQPLNRTQSGLFSRIQKQARALTS